MAVTFLCPNTCGFARIAATEISREISSSIQREKEESSTKYQARIKHEISVEPLQFHKRLPGLRNAINKWNFRKAHEKQKYLETFSRKNWFAMSTNRKKEHSFSNCKGCAIRNPHIQAFFTVKSSFLKGKAKNSNIVMTGLGEVNKLRPQEPSPSKPTVKNIKNAAKAIYDKVAPLFEKTFRANFAQCLSKIPELDLQYKTANEKRAERSNHYRRAKKNVEKQIEDTAFLR